MGNSLTHFDGYAFWEKDDVIMTWLCLLVRQIDKSEKREPFILKLRDHYVRHGTIFFGGAQCPGLNDYIDTSEKRAWLLGISLEALNELSSQGEFLSADWLTELEMMEGSLANEQSHCRGDEAPKYVEYGRKWIALLKGNPKVMDKPGFADVHIDFYYPGGEDTFTQGDKGYPRRKC